MISLELLRQDTRTVIAQIHKKDPSFDAQRLYDLDHQVCLLLSEVESLRKKKNELAEQGKQGVTPELRAQSQDLSRQLKDKEVQLHAAQAAFHELYLSCPNLPADDVPVGDKAQNEVVKVVGNKPHFDFPVKNHLDLATALGWLDFERAAVMTGSQFALYKGTGVQMLYALAMLMLKNNIKHGFQMVLPPCLVNEKSLECASNFPRFKDQVYAVPADELYLAPTAEVMLTNLYRDQILREDELPIRMTSWTSCYRREAGGYGATERGLIRIHQFEKVEIYTICTPEQAQAEHERMLACAEDILQQLGLHYRVSLLAGQDCSFPSSKTYDIEVWLPGQQTYYEVSSSSNCTDFQARRSQIRFKRSGAKKAELAYTLNTSSLALPRLMVALIESHQKKDGSVELPAILKMNELFGI